jgi:hypothetical protein
LSTFHHGSIRLRYAAYFAESCIRKAISEPGFNSSPVGLADATAEDEAASRWADCAVAYGDLMARPRASGRAGRGLWRDGWVPAREYRCGNQAGRGRDRGSPHPAR